MESSNARVLILGYGAFGQALHCAISPRPDLSISLFMRTETAVHFPAERVFLHAAAVEPDRFDIILVALPSRAIGDVLARMDWSRPTDAVFVSCAKGIDDATGLLPSQIILQRTGSSAIAVLSGASFSEEMLQQGRVFLSLACANPYMGESVIRRLQSPRMTLEFTDDVRGLEIAGVGKNLIALGAGMADGLGLGENFRAALIARGINELRSVIEKLGGRPETMITLGALSDVILTSSSPKSRNYRFGRALAAGTVETALSEGFNSLEAFRRMLQQHGIRSSYFETIVRSVDSPATIASVLS